MKVFQSPVTDRRLRFINLLRRCHECGQPLGKKDLFCPRCGAKQPRDRARSNQRIDKCEKI